MVQTRRIRRPISRRAESRALRGDVGHRRIGRVGGRLPVSGACSWSRGIRTDVAGLVEGGGASTCPPLSRCAPVRWPSPHRVRIYDPFRPVEYAIRRNQDDPSAAPPNSPQYEVVRARRLLQLPLRPYGQFLIVSCAFPKGEQRLPPPPPPPLYRATRESSRDQSARPKYYRWIRASQR